MRVKRGQTKRAKHKKVLKLAKGYRMTYSKLYRRAKEAVWHAGSYSLAHRKRRKSQMRSQWIQSISAALAGSELSYSEFMGALKKNNIEIDRKNLAEMATHNSGQFEALVNKVK